MWEWFDELIDSGKRYSKDEPLSFTWHELKVWNELNNDTATLDELKVLMSMSIQWRSAMIDELNYKQLIESKNGNE